MTIHDPDVDEATETLVAFVRRIVPALLASKRNWKISLNGAAGGAVRTVIEVHEDTVRQFRR